MRNGVRQKEIVDLIETFNYLLGLHVKRIRRFDENGTIYRVVHGEKKRKDCYCHLENDDKTEFGKRQKIHRREITQAKGLQSQTSIHQRGLLCRKCFVR